MNTLETFESLKAADFSDGQAKAITQAIDSSLQANSLELISDFRRELNGKLDKSDFEVGVARLESRLLRWMFVFCIGQVGATIAIVFSAIKLLK